MVFQYGKSLKMSEQEDTISRKELCCYFGSTKSIGMVSNGSVLKNFYPRDSTLKTLSTLPQMVKHAIHSPCSRSLVAGGSVLVRHSLRLP